MSKTSLCINMLEVLNSRKVVSIKELAEILETNKRNILEYKKELEYAGYTINTVHGRYGGYSLDKTKIFPSLLLTSQEINALYSGYNYLRSQNTFFEKQNLNSAMQKICSSVVTKNTDDILYISQNSISMNSFELQKRYNIAKKCIEANIIFYINYKNDDGIISEQKIYPVKLMLLNNEWSVVGYNINDYKIKKYKLHRITNIISAVEKFNPDKLRLNHMEEYLNNDELDVILQITGKSKQLTEDYVFGKNQTILYNENGSVNLSVKISKEQIKNLILSFGSDCNVVYPLWLKDEIIKTCNNIIYLNKKM